MKYIIALIVANCNSNPGCRYGYDNQQLVQLVSGNPTAQLIYNGSYDDLTSETNQALASGIAVNILVLIPLQQYVPINAVVSVPTRYVQMSAWIVQFFCKLFQLNEIAELRKSSSKIKMFINSCVVKNNEIIKKRTIKKLHKRLQHHCEAIVLVSLSNAHLIRSKTT